MPTRKGVHFLLLKFLQFSFFFDFNPQEFTILYRYNKLFKTLIQINIFAILTKYLNKGAVLPKANPISYPACVFSSVFSTCRNYG